MTIKKVQELLDYLDYSCTIDGIWGPETKKKLMQFQKDFGLTEDGMTGPDTYAALKHAVCYGLDVPDTVQTSTDVATIVQDVADGADQYLQADGKYHIPRGVNVHLTRNFSASEIHCQGTGCCAESIISKRVMDLAQAVRDDLGVPVQIATAGGSGYRCASHNAAVGGVSGSLHLIGDAVDFHANVSTAALKAAILRHLTDGEVGLYSWGCHAGCWDRGYISEFNG